jgi:hypothetical protein
MRNAWLVLLAFVLACGREQATTSSDRKTVSSAAAGASPEEHFCHLTVGGPSSVLVPIASEVGQQLEVARGTNCVVLDAAPALTRVRITDGPYAGTVGWAQSGTVVDGKARH